MKVTLKTDILAGLNETDEEEEEEEGEGMVGAADAEAEFLEEAADTLRDTLAQNETQTQPQLAQNMSARVSPPYLRKRAFAPIYDDDLESEDQIQGDEEFLIK